MNLSLVYRACATRVKLILGGGVQKQKNSNTYIMITISIVFNSSDDMIINNHVKIAIMIKK